MNLKFGLVLRQKRKQVFARISDAFVDHGVKQRLQCLPDRAPAITEGDQIVSVYAKIAHIEACVFPFKLCDDPLDFFEPAEPFGSKIDVVVERVRTLNRKKQRQLFFGKALHQPAHGGALGRDPIVVMADQPARKIARRVVRAKPAKNGVGRVCTDGGMASETHHAAFFVKRGGLRLGDVVQICRKAKRQNGRAFF